MGLQPRPGEAAEDAADGAAPSDALEAAIADHHGFLKKYLARRIKTPQDAEDYTQEVYLRALAFSRRETKIDNWRGIFIRIAADLIVDGFRRSRARGDGLHVSLDSVQDPGDAGLHSPERILAGRQTILDVERTLEALDPICRRAFILVRFHGHSYGEAAAVLNTTPIAIGRHIERAAALLAKARIARA